jgi:hypothetical protein
LDERFRLFPLRENAEREAHEIGISEQLRHKIDIVFAEWAQRQAGRFQNHVTTGKYESRLNFDS